jgi:hypothetical protein
MGGEHWQDASVTRPGDWVNLLNPGASKKIWENENAIAVGKDRFGKDQFFGHPWGIVTQDKAMQNLRDLGGTPRLGEVRYGVSWRNILLLLGEMAK